MSDALATRLDVVRDRIRDAGGDTDLITICAVTKGHPVGAVRDALGCGLVDIGENYAQEMLAKVAELGDVPVAPRWHAIGRLQRNKVRSLAPHVHLWQSVDRVELGVEIARRAPGAAVLVQVAPDGPSGTDGGKGGCAADEAAPLVEALVAEGLDVRGLMTIGPTDPDVDPRPGFARVRALADRLGLSEVSMGMSRDLEDAVREGATIVRPGTALFGPRPHRGHPGQ